METEVVLTIILIIIMYSILVLIQRKLLRLNPIIFWERFIRITLLFSFSGNMIVLLLSLFSWGGFGLLVFVQAAYFMVLPLSTIWALIDMSAYLPSIGEELKFFYGSVVRILVIALLPAILLGLIFIFVFGVPMIFISLSIVGMIAILLILLSPTKSKYLELTRYYRELIRSRLDDLGVLTVFTLASHHYLGLRLKNAIQVVNKPERYLGIKGVVVANGVLINECVFRRVVRAMIRGLRGIKDVVKYLVMEVPLSDDQVGVINKYIREALQDSGSKSSELLN